MNNIEIQNRDTMNKDTISKDIIDKCTMNNSTMHKDIINVEKINTADQKPKVAFICVHNSCRSQMAEAMGKLFASDVFESYSAGTEVKPQINQDAVRLMKEKYNIDMEKDQYSKLIDTIPQPDVVITMGCNVKCPYIPCHYRADWGLEDPTDQSDEVFLETMENIKKKVIELKEIICNENL